MAKETLSPKVKNADPSKRRGIKKGDKVVKRHKNKRPVARVLPGEDLLSHISAKTARPSRVVITDPEGARRIVINAVGEKMVKIVEAENWAAAVRPLVCDYITSLVNGDGTKPSDLANSAAMVVQRVFGDMCLEHNIAWNVLPGQHQDWFLERIGRKRQMAHAS